MTPNPDYKKALWLIISGVMQFRFMTREDMIQFVATGDYSIPVPAILFDEDNSMRN